MAQEQSTQNNKVTYVKQIKDLQKKVDSLEREIKALKRAFLSKGV
jgi:exonuclease VII small subunit